MNYSEKHTLLAKYLDVEVDEIIEMSPSSYDYNGDEYMILDDGELDGVINDQINYTADEVQHIIDVERDNVEYAYYISMGVDLEAIREDIESNLGEYIGTGTYELFEDYYIFLMQ